MQEKAPVPTPRRDTGTLNANGLKKRNEQASNQGACQSQLGNIARAIFKPRELFQECQRNFANGPISLLGND